MQATILGGTLYWYADFYYPAKCFMCKKTNYKAWVQNTLTPTVLCIDCMTILRCEEVNGE